jgi:hypothetical protein
MVQNASSHAEVLGTYRPATERGRELGLIDVVPFLSNPENRHGRTYTIPGTSDSVTILSDGSKVWFGVSSCKRVTGVELIGETGKAHTLFGSSHPAQLPAKNPEHCQWWQASRVRVLPKCKIRLVYQR